MSVATTVSPPVIARGRTCPLCIYRVFFLALEDPRPLVALSSSIEQRRENALLRCRRPIIFGTFCRALPTISIWIILLLLAYADTSPVARSLNSDGS